jgi:osmotically inducible protein OsmC
MAIKKYGSAEWQGGLKDGKGTISTQSGALDSYPYGYKQRFEGVKGSNPEELIGAAHASCFSMAFSLMLEKEGLTADYIKTKAEITLEEVEGGFAVSGSHLIMTAKIPGVDDAKFKQIADKAKQGCPISKLLVTKITLDASLKE